MDTNNGAGGEPSGNDGDNNSDNQDNIGGQDSAGGEGEGEVDDKQAATLTPQEASEERARAGGWKPSDEFDGDPKDWRSAEVFNERGEWIDKFKQIQKRTDDMESGFNRRMDNANKLHQTQLEATKKDLVRKRDEAIDDADREAANGFQDEIDTINSQPKQEDANATAAAGAGDTATLNDWNAKNQWIMGTDPKAAYAKQQFGAYQSKGMNATAALAAMEGDVSRAFPDINPKREQHPHQEGGSKPGKKRAARKLSMTDLSTDELKYYRAMPGAWGSEADYLQAVQDTRGAES